MSVRTPSRGAEWPAPPPVSPPVHCAMFALDIVAFGSHDAGAQLYLRDTMRRIVRQAADAVGLPLSLCHHEDRGDGLFFLAPACLGAEILTDPFVPHVWAGLRRHNTLAGERARLRMRAAVHAGYVRLDGHGAVGGALIHLFRLLDCHPLKRALQGGAGEFALAASDYLYDEVIRHGNGLMDPRSFRPITVARKETNARAWLWRPSSPPPAGSPRPASRTPPPPPRPLDLSREEFDVAMLVAAGRAPDEIAGELALTGETLGRRVERVRAELGPATGEPGDLGAALHAHLRASYRDPAAPTEAPPG